MDRDSKAEKLEEAWDTARKEFARKLMEEQDFFPTRSVYLDIIPGVTDAESILTLLWPQERGPKRVYAFWPKNGKSDFEGHLHIAKNKMITTGQKPLNIEDFKVVCEKLGIPVAPESTSSLVIVVYSNEPQDLATKTNLETALRGNTPWPAARWINLHDKLSESPKLMHAIASRRFAKPRSSSHELPLEALEDAFKITRPGRARNQGYEYSDNDKGLVPSSRDGPMMDPKRMADYTARNVRSLFAIVRSSEGMMFEKKFRAWRFDRYRDKNGERTKPINRRRPRLGIEAQMQRKERKPENQIY